MQLDDVVSSVSDDIERFKEATSRSIRWLDRCILAHKRPQQQNLFGIIQGGLDISEGGLRDLCLEAMIQRDLPGYAIGGLAGGEDKGSFWRVVAHVIFITLFFFFFDCLNAILSFQCAAKLPSNKPRYVMGVGYPLDLVVCVALGADMFDCVFPTRTARFGVALVSKGSIRLKGAENAALYESVDSECSCVTCRDYTRAYLHLLFKENCPLASQLLTRHNISYMMRLMRTMRQVNSFLHLSISFTHHSHFKYFLFF